MWSPLTLTPPLKVDRGQWRSRAGLAWAYWNRPITPQRPTSKQQLVPGFGLFESFDLDFEAPSAAPDLRWSWRSPASKFSSLRWSELCCLSAPATAKLILALGPLLLNLRPGRLVSGSQRLQFCHNARRIFPCTPRPPVSVVLCFASPLSHGLMIQVQ
jgi:hypothetical protein